MAATAVLFVSKRLQAMVAAFLCLAAAQLVSASLASRHAEAPTLSVRVPIGR